MKNTLTYIIALALAASQLIGCTATQTSTNNIKNNFAGMGNNNTCNLSHSTKAERKYLAYYRYTESLKNGYTQNSNVVLANNAANAGGAYMLITNIQYKSRSLPVPSSVSPALAQK